MANDKENKTFTNTEVGTLVESFRNDLGVIGERVSTLCEDVAVIKVKLSGVETEIRLIKDVIRVQIPGHEKRISVLETKVG